MKLRIEVDEKIQEDEIVIKCKEIDSNIENIKKVFSEMISKKKDIIFYKDEKEFYLSFPVPYIQIHSALKARQVQSST